MNGPRGIKKPNHGNAQKKKWKKQGYGNEVSHKAKRPGVRVLERRVSECP